jgi:hypothetical protein
MTHSRSDANLRDTETMLAYGKWSKSKWKGHRKRYSTQATKSISRRYDTIGYSWVAVPSNEHRQRQEAAAVSPWPVRSAIDMMLLPPCRYELLRSIPCEIAFPIWLFAFASDPRVVPGLPLLPLCLVAMLSPSRADNQPRIFAAG